MNRKVVGLSLSCTKTWPSPACLRSLYFFWREIRDVDDKSKFFLPFKHEGTRKFKLWWRFTLHVTAALSCYSIVCMLIINCFLSPYLLKFIDLRKTSHIRYQMRQHTDVYIDAQNVFIVLHITSNTWAEDFNILLQKVWSFIYSDYDSFFGLIVL